MARVGLVGFTGMGNVGDQAMTLAIVERLLAANHHPIVVLFGRCEDEEQCYRAAGAALALPYERYIVRELDALVVGGGTLHSGFGAQFVVPALDAKCTVVSFGQSYPKPLGDAELLLARMYRRIIVRDEASYKRLRDLNFDVVWGGDPAFGLRLVLPARERRGVAAFVRHPQSNWRPDDKLLDAIALKRPTYVACDQRDYDFAHRVLRVGYCARFRHPRAMLDFVAGQEQVVTVGRYHPAVFAAMTGTPCVAHCDKVPHDLGNATCSIHDPAAHVARCETGFAALMEAIGA